VRGLWLVFLLGWGVGLGCCGVVGFVWRVLGVVRLLCDLGCVGRVWCSVEGVRFCLVLGGASVVGVFVVGMGVVGCGGDFWLVRCVFVVAGGLFGVLLSVWLVGCCCVCAVVGGGRFFGCVVGLGVVLSCWFGGLGVCFVWCFWAWWVVCEVCLCCVCVGGCFVFVCCFCFFWLFGCFFVFFVCWGGVGGGLGGVVLGGCVVASCVWWCGLGVVFGLGGGGGFVVVGWCWGLWVVAVLFGFVVLGGVVFWGGCLGGGGCLWVFWVWWCLGGGGLGCGCGFGVDVVWGMVLLSWVDLGFGLVLWCCFGRLVFWCFRGFFVVMRGPSCCGGWRVF